MKNYGEELAYWYFRLNGFFPLTNFVTHKSQKRDKASNVDVLAIRFPYVYENIGGKQEDWDSKLSSLDIQTKVVGVICEVKTRFEGSVDKLFKGENLQQSVERLGFVEKTEAYEIAKQLETKKEVNKGEMKIAKILLSDREIENEHFYSISINSIIRFIKARISKYPNYKNSDRMFFESPLLQYLIYESTCKK
ncbi:MAG: hypothetical protein PHT79_07650 [Syntrophomonadaceae bacterium]|nr:hypothetical protein [Syntrophomonadaceae bacterium]MDD4549613.1 hypothetical protein [Syntrophomonadaceae bacterium]